MEEINWQSFAPITPNDHAGYIWIAVLYCTVVSTLVLATRTWIKKNIWGHDDTLFAIAFLVLLGHVAAVVVALKLGLGSNALDEEATRTDSLVDAGTAAFTAEITLTIALGLAKCSLLLFIKRILSQDSTKLLLASHVVLGTIACWTLASVVALAVNCSPGGFINKGHSHRCSNRGAKWVGIAAFDIFTELQLMALPVALVWPLQLRTKTKVEVVSAFLFRAIVAGAAIVHATYISRAEQYPEEGLAMVPVAVTAEAQLCWSMVSATIPNMKNFMKSFSTGFGHEFGLTTATTARNTSSPWGSRIRGGQIPLSNMSKSMPGRTTPLRNGTAVETSDSPYVVRVSGNRLEADEHSIGSGKSSEMIIRKNVTTSVEHWRT